LGTPKPDDWPYGYTLAENKSIIIPQNVMKQNLMTYLKYPTKEAVDFLE
jgi:hypothetical protein